MSTVVDTIRENYISAQDIESVREFIIRFQMNFGVPKPKND